MYCVKAGWIRRYLGFASLAIIWWSRCNLPEVGATSASVWIPSARVASDAAVLERGGFVCQPVAGGNVYWVARAQLSIAPRLIASLHTLLDVLDVDVSGVVQRAVAVADQLANSVQYGWPIGDDETRVFRSWPDLEDWSRRAVLRTLVGGGPWLRSRSCGYSDCSAIMLRGGELTGLRLASSNRQCSWRSTVGSLLIATNVVGNRLYWPANMFVEDRVPLCIPMRLHLGLRCLGLVAGGRTNLEPALTELMNCIRLGVELVLLQDTAVAAGLQCLQSYDQAVRSKVNRAGGHVSRRQDGLLFVEGCPSGVYRSGEVDVVVGRSQLSAADALAVVVAGWRCSLMQEPLGKLLMDEGIAAHADVDTCLREPSLIQRAAFAHDSGRLPGSMALRNAVGLLMAADADGVLAAFSAYEKQLVGCYRLSRIAVGVAGLVDEGRRQLTRVLASLYASGVIEKRFEV